MLAFHCGGALVVANLHPHESYPAYRVGSAVAGRFRLALDTDAAEFGGWGRLDPDTEVVTEGELRLAGHGSDAVPSEQVRAGVRAGGRVGRPRG